MIDERTLRKMEEDPYHVNMLFRALQKMVEKEDERSSGEAVAPKAAGGSIPSRPLQQKEGF